MSFQVPVSLRLRLASLMRLVAVIGAWLVTGSCTPETEPAPGQLMIALQTDMSLPKDVNRIRVQVSSEGVLRHDQTYVIQPDGETPLPATLAVVEGSKKNPTVEVRVIGFRKSEARVFAKVVTTIPRERVALLQIPVQWLCDESVEQIDDDTFDSTCEPEKGKERACRAGSCENVEVAESKLPDYEPQDVFGNADDPKDPLAVCFDTEGCFDLGQDISPDDNCKVEVELPQKYELNLGLRLASGGDGICGEAGCYVPLDRDPILGWRELGRDEDRITAQLPSAVCVALAAKRVLAVRASTACQTKTTAYPTCGPWSAIEKPAGIIPIELPAPTPSDVPGTDAGSGADAAAPVDAATEPDAAGPGPDAAVAQVVSLSAVAEADSVPLGSQLAVGVLAVFDDGSNGDVTAQVTWQSSDDELATVSDGYIQARGVGRVELTASLGDVSSEPIAVDITAAELVDVTIRRSTEMLGAGLVQLQLIGTYTDDSEADLTAQATWESTNEGVVQVDDMGVASAVGPGSARVVATVTALDGVDFSDSIPFDVTEEGAGSASGAGGSGGGSASGQASGAGGASP